MLEVSNCHDMHYHSLQDFFFLTDRYVISSFFAFLFPKVCAVNALRKKSRLQLFLLFSGLKPQEAAKRHL